MVPFEITILGTNSSIPTSNRFPSSQFVNISDRYFLIDCGEGTQMQLRKYKIRFQKINHIFISHLHGDHYLGLMGLLQSMHLLGRKAELHLYAPKELQEIIEIQHKHSGTHLTYELIFHPLRFNTSELIMEDDKVTVETIPLNHRIACWGFLFKEKPHLNKIKKEKIEEYIIPLEKIHEIKSGGDFITNEGKTIPNKELVELPLPPRSYAYCSDTRYTETIIPIISGVDLLYHEATFLEDLIERAKQTMHSTAKEAATIALKSNVKKLLIGHFSARYDDIIPLLEEAKTIFTNTELAKEGRVVAI